MTSPARDYSEDALVEQPAIALFESLGWETMNCFGEFDRAGGSILGREHKGQVVLTSRLRLALERLNPGLPREAIELAIEELTRERGLMSMAQANREVYDLIKQGVEVKLQDDADDAEEGESIERVRVIDWNHPENNDFLLASQFWVAGEMYTRRADLVGFVNGLPILFVELKAAHRRLETAFTRNLSDYKDTIPHLFWYNALIVLSNGSRSKVGSVTANWEHYNDWKKITSEGEEGIISLDTVIRGVAEPARLCDLVENFTLFVEGPGGLLKLVAKNHQYLGVNHAIDAMTDIRARQGRLGVFWHTQGSGKSVSMMFFAQKVLRKLTGNWTFVVVTDRDDLDDQIYKNFAGAGVVTESQAQATSSAHLRRLLQEDHRYVFTLIQKFRSEPGTPHPVLSERSDIIVITDEAHRSQYDTLALNMRTALPNASFIAFTGTPLIEGEERTRQVFGDYVSIYNFRQSIEDGATVPLYYENRIPELQLTNEHLNEDMEQLLEAAELDEEQEKRLEREFSRQYHLITRDDRLETIAEDIVRHFMGRGFRGKAMVISIDKANAIRMYDKVQKYWQRELDDLKRQRLRATGEQREQLGETIRYMEETDMAVVVSSAQNEIEDMRRKGIDIAPHRRRMQTEDLDGKFKDPDDPFRIVFVCAMWMTGFDVPSCSTIYLDKPMRNHTLMQTIARANRVFGDKVNGLIVDYVGMFRDLEKALAIYGSGTGGELVEGESPVADKSQLVQRLREAIEDVSEFCQEHKIDLEAIRRAGAFERVKLLDDAEDAILTSDDTKQRYLLLASTVARLYKAMLPDPASNELAPICVLIDVIARKVRSTTDPADISAIMDEVEHLLDQSIAAEGYVITQEVESKEHLVDLSQVDFDALKARFQQSRKHTEAEKLRSAIQRRVTEMVRLNRSRVDYLEKFQAMIDEYNAGSVNVEEFFNRLVEFARSLSAEEQRSIAENLSEEELAIFDLLTKPDMELSKTEDEQVKKAAKELLAILKREKLVLDWRKHQQSRASVEVTIEEVLDRDLPDTYTPDIYHTKCTAIYQHVYESYYGAGRSVYVPAA